MQVLPQQSILHTVHWSSWIPSFRLSSHAFKTTSLYHFYKQYHNWFQILSCFFWQFVWVFQHRVEAVVLRVMVWGVSALIEYVSGHWLKCALGLEAMVQLTVEGCLRLLDWNVCWGCLLNCNGLLCSRALDSNMHCVEAMVYQILHMLCKEGTYSEVNFNLYLFIDFIHG